MRIYGPNGTTLGTPANSTRRAGSSGFTLPEDAGSASESRATTAPKATANIDALLALQGIEEDPAERRRRSVQRGKGARVHKQPHSFGFEFAILLFWTLHEEQIIQVPLAAAAHDLQL